MPDSQFRILDFNYVFQPGTVITASSADSAFPVANVAHFHRAKAWHSSGTFVIGATNNKINFKEAAPELTATIASGTYSPTTLAAAIKTAMEAVGANDYTVTFSTTTGKWTIATSGGLLSLLWATGTDVANNVGPSLGFVVADQTGFLTYTAASIAIHTGERVVFDLGSVEDIDSLAILFDRRLGHGFTDAAVIRLQANATDVWTAPALNILLSIDEVYDIVTHFMATPETYRYWSLSIVDTANPNFFVRLPTIFLANATQLGQVPQLGWDLSFRDLSKRVVNDYGHRYADTYPTLRMMKFSYAFMAEADVTTLVSIYERVGAETPIMVCLDPTATVFDKDRFALYGYMPEKYDTKHSFFTFFDSGLVVEEAP